MYDLFAVPMETRLHSNYTILATRTSSEIEQQEQGEHPQMMENTLFESWSLARTG